MHKPIAPEPLSCTRHLLADFPPRGAYPLFGRTVIVAIGGRIRRCATAQGKYVGDGRVIFKHQITGAATILQDGCLGCWDQPDSLQCGTRLEESRPLIYTASGHHAGRPAGQIIRSRVSQRVQHHLAEADFLGLTHITTSA
jgi:hypothetical protein